MVVLIWSEDQIETITSTTKDDDDDDKNYNYMSRVLNTK